MQQRLLSEVTLPQIVELNWSHKLKKIWSLSYALLEVKNFKTNKRRVILFTMLYKDEKVQSTEISQLHTEQKLTGICTMYFSQ